MRNKISGKAEPTLFMIFVREIIELLSFALGVKTLGRLQKGTSATVYAIPQEI